MSLEASLISLAKTQRQIANEHAADIRAGRFPLRAEQKRIEVIRLRAAARTHLQWARRERHWKQHGTWNETRMEAAE